MNWWQQGMGGHVSALSCVVAALLATSGCSGDNRPPERLGQVKQELSSATIRTFGFESLDDWSGLYSSPVLSLSALHTQGEKSLALGGGGWMQVTSRRLSKEDSAPSVVGYDIRVASNPINQWWYGSTDLSIDAPSVGIWGHHLGHVELTGFPKGEFKRVEFPMPAAIQQKLNGNYTDLTFRIVVNVPNNEPEPYLLDRFTLGPASTTCLPQSDGNPCTLDTCVNGVPSHTPLASGTACDTNADVCDGTGACSATASCVVGPAPSVDDGNPCTADACNPSSGVTHAPVPAGSRCDDPDPCNGEEVCNESGECLQGSPPVVDDQNPCTEDSCSAPAGVGHMPLPTGTNCSDADVCNGDEACDGAGACIAGTPPEVPPSTPCLVFSCDAVEGIISSPKDQGTSCDNATVCDGHETCDGAGLCVSGTPPTLPEPTACTTYACDAVQGVIASHAASGTACDNATVCDGRETCDGTGSCVGGSAVVCVASDQCHDVGVCDPATGACSNPERPAGAACNDGNSCTQTDACQGGTCVGANPVICASSDACNDAGTCDPSTGACSVAVKPDGTSCADATLCNGDEICQAGTCVPGTPPALDDGNPCTVDSCDNQEGPIHASAPAGVACTDGDPCNGLEVCDGAGACVGGSPPMVDDLNPCTVDACDSASGVVTHTPLPEGTSCGDGQTCNASGICGGAPPVLDVPPPDATGATLPGEAWTFLYTGPNPVQTGVAEGAIEAERASLLSGRLIERDGSPVPNARVRITEGPQYGETRSRADGQYDLVVSGGGAFSVRAERSGYLTVDRIATVGWNETTTIPDAVMTRLDPVATAISLGAPTPQVAVGSSMTDDDGERQALLMVPRNTAGVLRMPDGSTVSADTLTLRLTEYTVGPQGPAAMPAPLPATTGYTYAIELSADEAIDVGARRVEFDRPLAFYVENFLDFPVGNAVPAGFYDGEHGGWAASTNGIVLRVLGVEAGLATLDLNGDGVAENATVLANAGISADERTELATRYAPGTSLWRVPVTHFTAWDCNWPFGPPPCDGNGACPGNDSSPAPPAGPTCGAGGSGGDRGGSSALGSIIKCEEQSLGEKLDVAGTPFSLNYRTTRTPSYAARRQIQLNLTAATIHSQLKSIEVVVDIAGQHYVQSFSPQPNLSTVFTWDGEDRFGRPVFASATARVEITTTFPGSYFRSGTTFGAASPQPGPQVGSRERTEVGYVNRFSVDLEGQLPPKGWALGGWTLSPHHFYDKATRTIHLGTGESMQSGAALEDIEWVAGDGTTSFGADGTSAKNSGLNTNVFETGFSAAPDGDIYFPLGPERVVRRIDHQDGTIWTVAGTRNQASCVPGHTGDSGFGDGGPATSARLVTPSDTAVASDGSVYIADLDAHRIRRIRPDGIIETVAGSGDCIGGFAGDGGPAVQALLHRPERIALANDGSLFITDTGNLRIRKVDPGGTITTVAGNGSFGFPASFNIRALASPMPDIRDIALGPNGILYVATIRRIFAVRRDGMLQAVSGEFSAANAIEDGLPMIDEAVDLNLATVATGLNGTLYFNDSDVTRTQSTGSFFVRAMNPTGIVRSISRGVLEPVDGGLALGNGPVAGYSISGAPDGSVLVADTNHRIYRLRPNSNRGCDPTSVLVPSPTGDQGYCFDRHGRHTRTIDVRTGAALFSFDYANDELASITDGDGNVTSISRTASTISITGPFGQTTTIELDSSGNPSSIGDALGVTLLEPQPKGLLDALVDRRGFRHEFQFSSDGLLIEDANPAGGVQSLVQTLLTNGKRVTRTTALGRSTLYDLVRDPAATTTWTTTAPDATATIRKKLADGTFQMRTPDATLTTETTKSDPQLGVQGAYVGSRTVRLPSSLTHTSTENRSATFATPGDLLSLTSQTVTNDINGRLWTTSYSNATRTYTYTSPLNRHVSTVVDALGRTVRFQREGLTPIDFAYDEHGRLFTVTRGNRVTTSTYETSGAAAGYLEAVNDALGITTDYTRDALGRTLTKTRDGLTTSFSWDAAGNLETVTPPGQPSHEMTYTPIDQLEAYAPPAAGLPSSATSFDYDVDRMLRGVTRPDGVEIVRTPDATGRLDTVAFPGGVLDYDYHAAGVSSGGGRLSGIAGPYETALSFTYDGFLTTSTGWSGGVVGNVAWQYDNDFNKIRETVTGRTGSGSTFFAYDNDQLLTCASPTSCSGTSAVNAIRLARNPQNGLITGTALGSTTDALSYNASGELARQTSAFGATPIADITYDAPGAERDGLGRIVRMREVVLGNTRELEYTYDALGRLTDVVMNGALAEHFAYDLNGNRTAADEAGVGTWNGSYDDQDRLLSYGPWQFTYTANGELQTKVNAATSDAWSFQYDAVGNLISVELPGGDRIDYLVDGMGRRVGKKKNGTLLKQWLYRDGLSPVAELDGAGALVSVYGYGSKPNVPDYVQRGSNTYRLISDHLGSPRYAVNIANSSDVALFASYTSFGKATGTGLDWIPFGFAGGIYDPDTGLVRFGARDYDSSVGRWVSKDPIRFGGGQANLYVYTFNDPVNYRDPSGTDGLAEDLGKQFRDKADLEGVRQGAKLCAKYPKACAAGLACLVLGDALFESSAETDKRMRDYQADEYNRSFYQDADGTQSQDTLSGGESIDPYLGGMSEPNMSGG